MAAFGACRGGGLQTGLRGRRIEQAGRPGRKLGFRAQSRDGGQQLAPMPDRSYAKADQVFGREFGQHIAINIVVAEGALILFKAETIKPGYNVHLCLPRSSIPLYRGCVYPGLLLWAPTGNVKSRINDQRHVFLVTELVSWVAVRARACATNT